MKTEIELAKQAGWEYADDDRGFEPLWRFAELVRADERNATLEEIAKWLEDEKDAPYWAELVRARRNT